MSSSWARGQRTVKLRVVSIERWKKLAAHLELPVDQVVRAMLDLHVELTLKRTAWLSAPELAKRLAPGAAAYMQALKLAENRNGQVVLLDVERTVDESLMRRNVGLRKLPAVRARNLAEQLRKMHLETRGRLLFKQDLDDHVLELLRARASDQEIKLRWQNALLGTHPPVTSFSDLNRSWSKWETLRP